MSSGFVSEADLEERRRVRKEMWQKTRRDSDPEEPPDEEVHDPRSLYERLQEQKDKKQEEWEEAHKLKNMVRGLEDDEVDFLELVDNTKIQEEKRIKAEENSALQEFRKKVSAMQQKAVETEPIADLKSEGSKKTSGGEAKRSSQMSLLAGAIKRKRDTDDTAKSAKTKSSEEERKTSTREVSKCESNSSGLQCVAVLPGLGVYTDSSDSDNDSNSDSEIESAPKRYLPMDITGRIIQCQKQAGNQRCS